MLVRDVMTETVVVADPTASVREIAELMRDRSVGSVVLVESHRPVGFITDRDLAISVVADGRDTFEPVSEHASTPVITAAPDMEIDEGAQLMVRHGVRRLLPTLACTFRLRSMAAMERSIMSIPARSADGGRAVSGTA